MIGQETHQERGAAAATLNGQNMGSDEAYNFVFKGEYMLSCSLDLIPKEKRSNIPLTA